MILTGLFLMLKIGGVLDMSWWWIVLFLVADQIATDVRGKVRVMNPWIS